MNIHSLKVKEGEIPACKQLKYKDLVASDCFIFDEVPQCVRGLRIKTHTGHYNPYASQCSSGLSSLDENRNVTLVSATITWERV